MLLVYRDRLSKIKLFARIGDIMKGIFSGLKAFIRMKDKLEFAVHTIIIWSFYIIMTWVVFYALPATKLSDDNSRIVPLYEYHHKDTEQRLYLTEEQPDKGRTRTKEPLCRVWKAPDEILIDSMAKSAPDF